MKVVSTSATSADSVVSTVAFPWASIKKTSDSCHLEHVHQRHTLMTCLSVYCCLSGGVVFNDAGAFSKSLTTVMSPSL